MDVDKIGCTKTLFCSEVEALKTLNKLKSKNKFCKLARVYKCHCGGWHMTSKVQKENILASEITTLKDKLNHALANMKGQQERNKRLAAENKNLKQDLSRLISEKFTQENSQSL